MKKSILVLTAGILLLSACNNGDEMKKPAGNAVAEMNLKAVNGINDAIMSGDYSKLGDYIAADAVDHSNPTGDIKGLDSIRASMQAMSSMATNMKYEILKEFADSTTTIQWLRFTGTAKQAMGPNMPAGSNYDMTAIEVIKMKDGKAVEHWEYMLAGDVMKMMPPPPPPAKK